MQMDPVRLPNAICEDRKAAPGAAARGRPGSGNTAGATAEGTPQPVPRAFAVPWGLPLRTKSAADPKPFPSYLRVGGYG